MFLEFMGMLVKVNQEDGGSLIEGDVPFIKGTSLKFTGCGGGVDFSKIKVGLECLFLQFTSLK